MPGDEALEEGDVVSIDPATPNPWGDAHAPFMVKKSARANDPNLLGVVLDPSSGASGNKVNDNYMPLSIYGYFPVKANLENGPIARGDYLTSSSVPGVAMKQTAGGPTLGVALEPLETVASGSYSRIQIFANTSWYGGDLNAKTGTLVALGSASYDSSGLLKTSSGLFDIDILFASIVQKFEKMFGVVFQQGLLKVAEIITGKIMANQICVGSTCVNEEQLKQLLQNGGASAQPLTTPPPLPSPSPSESPVISPTPELTSEPSPSTTPEIMPSPTPVISETPVPVLAPEPTSEQQPQPEPQPEAAPEPPPAPESPPAGEAAATSGL